jgi:hypothetical protein
MANVIRHCRHLVNFRYTRNNRLYSAKVLNGFKDYYEPIKIAIIVIIIFIIICNFKWRGRHHAYFPHWQCDSC